MRCNPDLHAERVYQIDGGLNVDYGHFRAGVSGFYAWIHEYITYEARDDSLSAAGLEGGLGVTFVNTDLATLSGTEFYSEWDCTDCITPFARLSYVKGTDHTRGSRGIIPGSEQGPLPSIAPLESRLGVRFHEAGKNPCWGLELATRVVAEQDRVASSLLEQESPGFTTYDLRSFWRSTDHLSLVAGVENFTAKHYHEHLDLRTGLGVFQPGINGYFGFELQY